jgi:hypothetical protein
VTKLLGLPETAMAFDLVTEAPPEAFYGNGERGSRSGSHAWPFPDLQNGELGGVVADSQGSAR